ncbi:MAG: hypothetical protein H0U57_10220 [Tatlockia sp.]|nr:hypothetical protein [Tatlockia sp.]
MYSKNENGFSNYTDKNLVQLIEILTFDKNSLPKFFEDRKNRIKQMSSVEEITNLILAASSKCFKIKIDMEDRYGWDKEAFIKQFCVEIFKNQFNTLFKYEEFINLISKLCEADERNLAGTAASIIKEMLHLIKDGDQLIQVLKIMGKHLGSESIDLIELVEKMWAENAKSKHTNSINSNASQFFNSHSSESNTSSNTDSSSEDEDSTNDSSASSSSSEYSLSQ